MSDAQNQGEPTMEEILASIRKIISEDGTPEGAEAADQAEAPEEVPADAPADAPAEAPEEAAAADAEAPAPEAAAPGEEAPAEEAADDDDVLDLTRMVGEDGSVEDLAEADEEAPAAAPEIEEEAEAPADLADDLDADDIGAEIPDLIAVDDTAAPALAPAADDGSLLANTTQAAVTATLTNVAAAGGPTGGVGMTTDGGKPLEILVREVLEPYLKTWLDENLAGLVERIVRDEVQKMARRAEYR